MPKAIFIESAIYTQVQVQDCWILAAKFFFVFFKDWDEVKVNKKAKKNKADFQPWNHWPSLVNNGFITWPYREICNAGKS